MISSLPLSSVRKVGGFWGRYIDALAQAGLKSQWEQILATGRLENFYRVARKESGTHEGMRFNDSDVYKWLEAACTVLQLAKNDEVMGYIQIAVDAVCSAQEPDGYIFTQIQLNQPDAKWKCLTHCHEMYCKGHLVEAAIAHYQLTGSTQLLDCAKRAVDSIISLTESSDLTPFCGHPELEIALYRLWETTGDVRYAELADGQIDARGSRPSIFDIELANPEIRAMIPAANHLYLKGGKYHGAYAQDDKPIREQDTIVGHSVRAAYLYAAAAWSAARRGDGELHNSIQTIWDNLTQKRMYVTGGIGSTGANEGFSDDYDLPNFNAYAETCAGIALAMWGRRMFEATGSQEYLEIVERTTYNGILSGISLDTTKYFYENPLESRHNHERQLWFPCACCPPNVARFIGGIPQYSIWTDASTIYIGTPLDIEFQANGLEVSISTDFPASGKLKVQIKAAKSVRHRVAIRIPDWSEEMELNFPELEEPAEYENGFAVIDREWSGTTSFEIDFTMAVQILSPHPRILDNVGRFAVTYGPSVYCVESDKFEESPNIATFATGETWQKTSQSALDKCPGFLITGYLPKVEQNAELYQAPETKEVVETEFRLIPYRTWGQSGASYMQVWLRED